jgi:hypothetical protein
MDEIKSLREDIAEHNKVEDRELKKILQWKWMAAGGVVALAWVFSHINLDMLSKLFN